jgi:AGCS family alanine or glycine:cation symporter
MLSNLLSQLVNFAWGLPLVLLLVGGGLGLAIHSRFPSSRGFSDAFRLITGRFKHDRDAKDAGQISSFQAMTTALSATVGLGNSAGVAISYS